ncbi:hypothetical protein NPIL_456431 [Nephila pilipes]|uniref:Uncharacterized protein n=1 Tax=Nephila pilipes TaxID=299642 RepID=A0A8X6M723_NEPPI|nr:hypothetical protein NPIL_456431 [Nephila pilipes]
MSLNLVTKIFRLNENDSEFQFRDIYSGLKDESKKSILGSDGNQMIRRKSNTRYETKIPSVEHGGGWDLVRAAGV